MVELPQQTVCLPSTLVMLGHQPNIADQKMSRYMYVLREMDADDVAHVQLSSGWDLNSSAKVSWQGR